MEAKINAVFAFLAERYQKRSVIPRVHATITRHAAWNRFRNPPDPVFTGIDSAASAVQGVMTGAETDLSAVISRLEGYFITSSLYDKHIAEHVAVSNPGAREYAFATLQKIMAHNATRNMLKDHMRTEARKIVPHLCATIKNSRGAFELTRDYTQFLEKWLKVANALQAYSTYASEFIIMHRRLLAQLAIELPQDEKGKDEDKHLYDSCALAIAQTAHAHPDKVPAVTLVRQLAVAAAQGLPEVIELSEHDQLAATRMTQRCEEINRWIRMIYGAVGNVLSDITRSRDETTLVLNELIRDLIKRINDDELRVPVDNTTLERYITILRGYDRIGSYTFKHIIPGTPTLGTLLIDVTQAHRDHCATSKRMRDVGGIKDANTS